MTILPRCSSSWVPNTRNNWYHYICENMTQEFCVESMKRPVPHGVCSRDEERHSMSRNHSQLTNCEVVKTTM